MVVASRNNSLWGKLVTSVVLSLATSFVYAERGKAPPDPNSDRIHAPAIQAKVAAAAPEPLFAAGRHTGPKNVFGTPHHRFGALIARIRALCHDGSTTACDR